MDTSQLDHRFNHGVPWLHHPWSRCAVVAAEEGPGLMSWFVNWNLIKHPLNWATVVLMVLIAGIFLRLLSQHIKIQTAAS